MRIAILSRYQNTINRGAESFVIELTRQLDPLGEVCILSGSDADSLKKILSGHFDVVVSMNGRLQSLMASLGRFLGKYKLVITGQSGIGRDDIWNIVVARPDVFVALTEKMFKWSKKWSFFNKVVKIPNGVDLKVFSDQGVKFSIDLKPPIVLSVGALVWYKHHERTINALERLPNASLLIVGSGEEKENLAKMATQKLGEKRFKIISAKYSELPSIYRLADVFALPSWDREAFGIVYLEALASNLAVVAPDDLNRKEIVGDGGILVDVSKTELFSQAILKALETDWGMKPRLQAEKFSWDKVGSMYQELFKKLVK